MEALIKPEECRSIDEVRQQIDQIDFEIIRLFGIRNYYIKAIVPFKADEDEVIACNRKSFVIDQRTKMAADCGLDHVLFRQIFTMLVEANVLKELELFKRNRNITLESK
jgi:isochorismate pyruvate lyase